MGKRKHKDTSSEDSKENRLEKKVKRLMEEFKKYNKRGRKSSRNQEARAKISDRTERAQVDRVELEHLFRSPSHSSCGSTPALEVQRSQPLSPKECYVPEAQEITPIIESSPVVHVPAENQSSSRTEENTSSSSTQKEKATDSKEEVVIEDLEAEILEAIGSRVAEERVLAPAIPKSVAVRMEDILKKGLPKEEREKLLKKSHSSEELRHG